MAVIIAEANNMELYLQRHITAETIAGANQILHFQIYLCKFEYSFILSSNYDSWKFETEERLMLDPGKYA